MKNLYAYAICQATLTVSDNMTLDQESTGISLPEAFYPLGRLALSHLQQWRRINAEILVEDG
jgi:hypothetical protein